MAKNDFLARQQAMQRAHFAEAISAQNESKKPGNTPAIKEGDIVRVESCHSAEPHFYEVDRVCADGVVSQPACFRHRYNEITAVYRYDGKNFACIWEG